MFLMSFGMLLFWVLIITAAVLLFRSLGRPAERGGDGQGPWSGPERVLAERYARGEIDDEEYHRRLDTLRVSGPPGTGKK
ncbi:hypothetical protein GCM10009716_18840 [Streptomyces sodiiphilus]|uniref:SHOCT domain-containing protein n=1 Tax=Streptomyces sodiiphilus TaxID=226217 RepID=A0ABP5ADQ2_9ACTN